MLRAREEPMSNAGAANADAVAPAAAANADALGEDEGHPARWLIMAVLAAVAFMARFDGRRGNLRRYGTGFGCT
jgi:hypothetical protein